MYAPFHVVLLWMIPPSSCAARELVSLPQPAKPPPHTAALVLVDRVKDVGAPALHGDHLLDRVFGLLPHAAHAAPDNGNEHPCKVRWVLSCSSLTADRIYV